jgi:hypothetical protein
MDLALRLARQWSSPALPARGLRPGTAPDKIIGLRKRFAPGLNVLRAQEQSSLRMDLIAKAAAHGFLRSRARVGERGEGLKGGFHHRFSSRCFFASSHPTLIITKRPCFSMWPGIHGTLE